MVKHILPRQFAELLLTAAALYIVLIIYLIYQGRG